MHKATAEPKLFGLVAQYEDSEKLLEAAQKAKNAGYVKMDAYSPFYVEGLVDALGNKDDRVPKVIFVSGITGACLGMLLQWWTSNVDYPMNIGGRPDFSWPQFIPVTFESGILCAAFGAVVGMLLLNGLPRPHHPIFNASGIERATDDRFFLCIEATDPNFDEAEVKKFLAATGAEQVVEATP
jgi:hypothetical protein